MPPPRAKGPAIFRNGRAKISFAGDGVKVSQRAIVACCVAAAR